MAGGGLEDKLLGGGGGGEDGVVSRLFSVAAAFWPLGFITFGGPSAHIGVLHRIFVEQRQWVDEARFLELLGVGQGIPGPTSTQMVVAIGTMRAGVLGGLLAMVLFQLPGFLTMLLFGLFVQSIGTEGSITDGYLEATVGLTAGATALVVVAAYTLAIKVCAVDPLKRGIAAVTAIAACLVRGKQGMVVFPSLMFLSGLTTYIDFHVNKNPPAGRYPPLTPSMLRDDEDGDDEGGHDELKGVRRAPGTHEVSRTAGWCLLAAWVAILVAGMVLRSRGIGGWPVQLWESFFRVGSIIIGGGQVVLPMLQTELVEPGWLPESTFFNGLAIVQALPGPLFNLAAYLGAAYKGVAGGIIAWCGLFGPGLLLIFAFLPFWERLRRLPVVRAGLVGVNCAAVGLIIGAVALLWDKGIHNLGGWAVVFVVFAADQFTPLPTPAALAVGGLVGWLLFRLNLGGPYCNVPTFTRYYPQFEERCAAYRAYYNVK